MAWNRFTNNQGVRAAAFSLYTSSQSDWFVKTGKANDEFFFGPMRDELEWFVFYSIFPDINAQDSLYGAIGRLGWQKKSNIDIFDRFPQLHQVISGGASGIDQWLTPHGATVYTWPVVVNLPEWMIQDAGAVVNDKWLRCANVKWKLHHALYTAACMYHLLDHPVLTLTGYHYLLRFDFDLWFKRPVPFNIFSWMSRKNCSVMHSMLETGPDTGCQHEAPQIVDRYAREYNVSIASQDSDWWYKENMYFYGNLQAFGTSWFHSPENIRLARWLWNDRVTAGYFQYRHGDQAYIIRMLGMFYKLSTKDLQHFQINDKDEGPVCDLYSWRTSKVFTHQE